jgi:hypothetical protein
MDRGRLWSSRHLAPGLALALLLGASPGRASASLAPPVARLLSPAAGDELTVGSLAVVEWEPAAGLAAMPHAEEWEAFLSVDGGKTHPLRITPHLDLSIRQFTFRVPDLTSRQARLLLRFGDERREVELDAPQTFAIRRVEGTSPPPWPLRPRMALTRGEAARAQEPGVVVWVEGDRDGEGLREVAVADFQTAFDSAVPAGAFVLPLLWPAPSRAALVPPAVTGSRTAPAGRPAAASAPPPAGAAAPVRLLIHRFNE